MMLLTVRNAAHRLGVGYSTLKQWIYSGKVRTTTTAGGHHRISDAEVERLQAQTQPASLKKGRQVVENGLIVSLSGRNRLHGFIDEVRRDGLVAQVRLRVGDQTLTAVITSDAVDELKLRRGDDAVAIIKSTDVLVARELQVPRPRAKKKSNRRS